MSDPLEVLRVPPAPAAPDPDFAARLRARMERALGLPRGVAVSTTTVPSRPTVPGDHRAGGVIPYLGVYDARAALDWYVEVLGARRQGEPYVMPDGRIGHAELALPDGVVFLAEGDWPELGVVAAVPGAATSTVSLVLRVTELDRVLRTARQSGARVVREPYEGYGSRNATIFDPFGHRWMLTEPVAAAASGGPPVRYRHGDTAYVSLWVPDVDRAAAFYGAVLGWAAAGEGAGRHVGGTLPAQGLWTSPGPPAVLCCYVVDDLAVALESVVAAGGEAGPPADEPYGRTAMCTDDQGARFALVQLPPATGGEAGPPEHGRGPGDIAYLSMSTPDSAAARAFYGAVLGWRFTPGRSADGWDVAGVAPKAGLGGGADAPRVAPVYRVDDITAAVLRVRSAGGSATEPVRRPYGLNADCMDDQGLAFYLVEL